MKLDIKKRDKYPNIDGYIEIVNEARQVLGKLEAQVKKLPDNCGSSPKLPCPLSLIAYAKVTTLPVLFVGVDVKQRRAYWLPVSDDLVRDKAISDKQQRVSVSFHPGRIVEEKETRYVIEWLRIAEDYQMKLREHDKRVATITELLKSSTLTAATAASPGFREIHEFLDELNSLLEKPFSLVKTRFYPEAWKVGLAYRDFTPNSVTYTLFPIRPEENEAQIKEIDSTRDLLTIDGITGYFTENPIRTRPKQHAVKAIQDSVKQILEGKLLDHKGSNVLATEFLFAIADRFAEQMGLEKKDNYTIAQIENAFYCRLPIWVHEAVEFMVRENRNGVKSPIDCLYRKPYFDPDMLRSSIMPEEMKVLGERVEAWLERHDAIPKIPLGYERLPLGFFEEYHSFLISNGVAEIHRLYKPPDYARAARHGGHVSELYSPDDLERNLEIFSNNLAPTYSAIVNQNFPLLKDYLTPFGGATRVVVVLDTSQNALHGGDWPITIYNLKLASENSLGVDFYEKSKWREIAPNLEVGRSKQSVELDNRTYEYIGGQSRGLDFMYGDLPMFGFVYEQLEEALRRYFELKLN